MLPRLDNARPTSQSVRISGEIAAEKLPQQPGPVALPRYDAVALVASKMVRESHANCSAYPSEMKETQRILSRCAVVAAEEKAERRELARMKRARIKASLRPENPFESNPQPGWKDAGATQLPPIPALSSLNRKPYIPMSKPIDDASPIEQLKNALARSFTRVVSLFRKWDVNCDGHVSIDELHNAIGALRLHDELAVWDDKTCKELFRALDTNGNGSIDFYELHHALRHYHPPPFESTPTPRSGVAAPAAGDIVLTLPRRREKKREGSGKQLEAVAEVKRMLAANQQRVIDLFRRWDFDMDASITPIELKRAMAALSIDIDMRTLKLLFKQFDTDGSGEISFNELNKALRRQVDFDAGHGERFDAATGTYTTGHMTVTQAKRSGGGDRTSAVPKLPKLEFDMQAHVDNVEVSIVGSARDDHAALARRRQKHADAGADREVSDFRKEEKMKHKAKRSIERDGVRDRRASD